MENIDEKVVDMFMSNCSVNEIAEVVNLKPSEIEIIIKNDEKVQYRHQEAIRKNKETSNGY